MGRDEEHVEGWGGWGGMEWVALAQADASSGCHIPDSVNVLLSLTPLA